MTFDEAIVYKERLFRTLDDNKEYGIMFVGTKGDLLYDEKWKNENQQELYPKRFVDRNKVIQQTIEWNIPYIESSSKDKKNVEFVFEQVLYEFWIQSQG